VLAGDGRRGTRSGSRLEQAQEGWRRPPRLPPGAIRARLPGLGLRSTGSAAGTRGRPRPAGLLAERVGGTGLALLASAPGGCYDKGQPAPLAGCPAPAMRTHHPTSAKRQEGQVMVEFALVLPILLAIVFGIFDFGKAYNYQNDLTFLANQAARYAEVNACAPCNGQKIGDYVVGTADTNELKDNATISFCLPNGTSNVGDPLKVTAAYTYNWLSFMQGLGLPTTTQLHATVTVRIMQAPDGTLYSAGSC
jgi:uncharacterized protein (UPF0333 family)